MCQAYILLFLLTRHDDDDDGNGDDSKSCQIIVENVIGHLQILSAMVMDFELLLEEKVKGTSEITHVYIYIPKGKKGCWLLLSICEWWPSRLSPPPLASHHQSTFCLCHKYIKLPRRKYSSVTSAFSAIENV